MKRRIATAMMTAVLALALSGSAIAAPKPPTNGGNGAGQSGQCTGSASARPTSCQSPGGVSGR
jgi:uncharacterized membrane protein